MLIQKGITVNNIFNNFGGTDANITFCNDGGSQYFENQRVVTFF